MKEVCWCSSTPPDFFLLGPRINVVSGHEGYGVGFAKVCMIHHLGTLDTAWRSKERLALILTDAGRREGGWRGPRSLLINVTPLLLRCLLMRQCRETCENTARQRASSYTDNCIKAKYL